MMNRKKGKKLQIIIIKCKKHSPSPIYYLGAKSAWAQYTIQLPDKVSDKNLLMN